MGLKKTITILDDITVTDAYFKILSTIIDWEKQVVHFNLGCWKSRAACRNGKKQLPLTVQEIISPEWTNPQTGIIVPARYESRFPVVSLPFVDDPGLKSNQYTMLKTVSFYSDATDITD